MTHAREVARRRERNGSARRHNAACLSVSTRARAAVGLVGLFLGATLVQAAPISGKHTDAQGRQQLIIGQTTDGIYDYVVNSDLPTPYGVTMYAPPNLASGGFTTANGGLSVNADWYKYGYGPQDLGFIKDTAKLNGAAIAVGYWIGADFDYDLANGTNLSGENANNLLWENTRRMITDLKNTGRPVFLRIGYEAEAPWNGHYPASYQAVWTKIKNEIAAQNAGNIATVWQLAAFCPATDFWSAGIVPRQLVAAKPLSAAGANSNGVQNIPETNPGSVLDQWYPGDQADWTGISIFDPQDCQRGYASIQAVVDYLKTKGKPIMVAEAAARGYDYNPATGLYSYNQVGKPSRANLSPLTVWQEWYQPFFSFLRTNSEHIRAVAYISDDWQKYSHWQCRVSSSGEKLSGCEEANWGNTRVDVNATLRDKWLAELTTDGKFIKASGGIVDPPPPPPPPTDTPPAGFSTRCAGENQTCSFTGNADVVYGARNTWSASKRASGSIACDNATFGDPLPGVGKSCYYKSVDGGTAPPGGGGTTPTGSKLFLIGQSNKAAWDAWLNVGQEPNGGSVYYEVKTGSFVSGMGGRPLHKEFADFVATMQGKYLQIGVSWKDNPPGWNGDDAIKAQASIDATAAIGRGKYLNLFDNLIGYINSKPGTTFLLRLDYEVSDNFHCESKSSCQYYKDAYNRLAAYIRGKNTASNVRFVFHPVRGQERLMYPGDTQVDWVGVSIFNHDLCMPLYHFDRHQYNGEPGVAYNTATSNCVGYILEKDQYGNDAAKKHEFDIDGNILSLVKFAKDRGKPVIYSEAAPMNFQPGQNADGTDSDAQAAEWARRFFKLMNYVGPLPNQAGTFDLSGTVKAVVYMNLDLRWGWDGYYGQTCTLSSPGCGFSRDDMWYNNVELHRYDQFKTTFCNGLSSNNFAVRCGTDTGTPPADNRAAEGYLDQADNAVFRGWARDLDFNGPVQVQLYVNDALFTTVTANQPRSDLSVAGIGDRAFSVTHAPFGPGTYTVKAVALGLRSDGTPSGSNVVLASPKSFTVSGTPTDKPPAGFTTRCASENQTCSFSGTADVVYGARTSWSAPRRSTGNIACNNATFGDPLPGIGKACYFKPVSTSGDGTPYRSVSLPGRIEAENYNSGDSGMAYSDNDAANQGGQYRNESVDIQAASEGGFNVGWVQNGEWLKYTVNVPSSGSYQLALRVASPHSTAQVKVEVDGVDVSGILTVPNTGDWQAWRTIQKSGINLSAGQHVIRVVAINGGFNLNWIEFTAAPTPVVVNLPGAVNTTAFTGSRSFNVNVSTSGAYYFVVGYASSANSKLIRLRFNGTVAEMAVNAGSGNALSIDFNNVGTGGKTVIVEAEDGVAIHRIEAFRR